MNSPYIGLDIGLRRTGVALSMNGKAASPLTVIENKPPHFHRAAAEIAEIIRNEEAQTVIIGLPLTAAGQPTEQAEKIRRLAGLIEEAAARLDISPRLIFTDEFYSTKESGYGRGGSTDADAAAVILQRYLDSLPYETTAD